MPYNVVSFSGGKDSTAMLLMMLEKGIQVDEIVCCDTGMEFPQMYEHQRKVEEYIGRPITYLKYEQSFEYMMFERPRKTGKYAGKVNGYGWARPHARWCTSFLKTKLIDKYFRDHSDAEQFVGIAFDEQRRCRGLNYPLVDWKVTEKQALEYCYGKGFDWGGLYERMDRCSCWCCPLQNLKSLKALYHNDHDLWARLRDMDERSWNQFRIDYSVRQLEERFSFEDRQMTLEIEVPE